MPSIVYLTEPVENSGVGNSLLSLSSQIGYTDHLLNATSLAAAQAAANVAKFSMASKQGQKNIDFEGDVAKLKMVFPHPAWDKPGFFEEVVKRRKAVFGMTRDQRDFFMYGMLTLLDGGAINNSPRLKHSTRRNMRTFYYFDFRTPIPRDLFLAIHGISKKYLDALRVQMRDHGPKPRLHGNKKRLQPPPPPQFEEVE